MRVVQTHFKTINACAVCICLKIGVIAESNRPIPNFTVCVEYVQRFNKILWCRFQFCQCVLLKNYSDTHSVLHVSTTLY